MRNGKRAIACVGGIVLLATCAWPQQLSKMDRDNVRAMMDAVASDVRKHYYDPTLHGVDWDAKVDEARKKIDQSSTVGMALSHIAAALDTLDDSHTFFLPPPRTIRYDYGVEYQMVGNKCFVTAVRPQSDADVKGVKPGDEILTVNTYNPTRDTLWKIRYVFSALRPQPSLQLSLKNPAGVPRQVEVATKFHQGKLVTDLTFADGGSDVFNIIRQEESQDHLMRARYANVGEQLLIFKLPEFAFTPIEVGAMIGRARKYPNLILDLRGNPGGDVDTLAQLVGGMFDKDVKIADRVGRKENKPQIAKGSHDPFKGKLIVLVDSQSASAAEIFARVMQIEKRGEVYGDRTSGSVMESRHYPEKIGSDVVKYFGVSVTDADLIMTDGKSLEHAGVTPDRLLIPSASAVAAGRDPVLAAAAQALGVTLSSEDAGKLFPYEWSPDN